MFKYLKVFTFNDEFTILGPLNNWLRSPVELALELGIVFLVRNGALRPLEKLWRHLNLELGCYINRVFGVLRPALVHAHVVFSDRVNLQTPRADAPEAALCPAGSVNMSLNFEYEVGSYLITYSKSTVVPSFSQVISGRGCPFAAHSKVTFEPSSATVLRGVARKLGASLRSPSSASSASTVSFASALMRYLSTFETLHR